MKLRAYTPTDGQAVWQILEPIIRAGETYALDRDLSRQQALDYWLQHEAWVAELDDQVAGTYYLRRNQAGGGSHVCNCGYATSTRFQGRGVAQKMCLHSMQMARERGFRAMQFNFVVASNQGALYLWRKLGFQEVGRLPQAFAHPDLGLQDALVLHQFL
ncbi:GNAT family N-acetyltransferase [bacterium]|nr:GNAT family N-acetyltransferase [bacterium]